MVNPVVSAVPHTNPPGTRNEAAWQASKDLEASFLSEMIKFGSPKERSPEFRGGIGEDHFESFLFDLRAKTMVDAGGIGLAEKIYASLSARKGT